MSTLQQQLSWYSTICTMFGGSLNDGGRPAKTLPVEIMNLILSFHCKSRFNAQTVVGVARLIGDAESCEMIIAATKMLHCDWRNVQIFVGSANAWGKIGLMVHYQAEFLAESLAIRTRDIEDAALYDDIVETLNCREVEFLPVLQTLPNHNQFLVVRLWRMQSYSFHMKVFSPEMKITHRWVCKEFGAEALLNNHLCWIGVQKFVASFITKRRCMIFLKAELFRRITTQQMVYALEQETGSQVTRNAHDVLSKQWQLWTGVVNFITAILFGIFKIISSVIFGLVDQFIQFGGDTAAGIVDMLIGLIVMLTLCVGVRAIYRYFRPSFKMNSVKTVSGKDRFVQKREICGTTTYDVIVNGKLHSLIERSEKDDTSVEEMALPGSDLYPSISRPVGAIMVSTELTELKVVGCFWRYEDFLVTALHVANAVWSGTADVYLTGTVEGKRGVCKLNPKVYRVKHELFDPDQNLFRKELDVFVIPLSAAIWASVAVTKASVKKDSVYGQTVSAVGFVHDILMTSSGKTLPDSGATQLWHTASTNPGFSGSPLFCGNSVVGMHIRGSAVNNFAIRKECILHFSVVAEFSSSLDSYELYQDFKHKGHSVRFEEVEGEFALVSKNGKTIYGWTREQMKEIQQKELSHRAKFDLEEEDEETRRERFVASMNKPKVWLDYEDEAAIPDTSIKIGGIVVPVVTKVRGFSELPPVKAVHCGSVPSEQGEVAKYLDDHAAELTELGYDSRIYQWPEINPETEMKSVQNHLELFNERVKSIQEPPSEIEMIRCENLVFKMLEANRFEPHVDYKTRDYIVGIIDSSLVKDLKSPGRPYQADGQATNADVIAALTKEGLAQKVLDDWDDEVIELKCFLKPEPTKKKKIDAQMPRVITGLPLHKMIKHQAIFMNMLFMAVAQVLNSPMKYAFAPATPGHIEHLARIFAGRKLYESDKSTWDFNFFLWIFNMCERVTVRLAMQPLGMSDAVFEQYVVDIKNSFAEVRKALYVCTNGRVFQALFEGIMKSGWLLTIFINSMAQIVVHVMILIRMGFSDEEILSVGYYIMAGGDDVLQTFPDKFDTSQYLRVAAKLGIKISDFVERDSLHHAEYFSTRFEKHGGVWKFFPLRFTKHIVKLRTEKIDNVASALASHMANYCWDDRKFSFFNKMFKAMRQAQPDKFPLVFLKDKTYLCYKSKGMESDE